MSVPLASTFVRRASSPHSPVAVGKVNVKVSQPVPPWASLVVNSIVSWSLCPAWMIPLKYVAVVEYTLTETVLVDVKSM